MEDIGEQGEKTFYTTRRAEFEHLWGDNRRALALIDQAIQKNNLIFEPHRLRVEILLKEGLKSQANDELDTMRQMATSRSSGERKLNFRAYLETLSHYLQEIGQYADAKKVFDDEHIFSETERREGIRAVEIVQGFKAHG